MGCEVEMCSLDKISYLRHNWKKSYWKKAERGCRLSPLKLKSIVAAKFDLNVKIRVK